MGQQSQKMCRGRDPHSIPAPKSFPLPHWHIAPDKPPVALYNRLNERRRRRQCQMVGTALFLRICVVHTTDVRPSVRPSFVGVRAACAAFCRELLPVCRHRGFAVVQWTHGGRRWTETKRSALYTTPQGLGSEVSKGELSQLRHMLSLGTCYV